MEENTVIPVPDVNTDVSEFESESEAPSEITEGITEVETQEDFEEKRDKLVAAMMNDPKVFYKCIAESYIYMNALDTAVRKMQASGGIGGMMKMMFGKG